MTNREAQTTAFDALVWTLGEPTRAERLLALTGLDPAGLRARIEEPGVLAATLDFLAAHEPDMLACADALGIAPARLASAREALGA